MTNETQQLDPKQVLRALYKAYVGKEADVSMTGTQIRAALRETPRYKEVFSRFKDEGATLDELQMQVTTGDVPCWLINPDHENSFGGKVKGHGAQFLLPDGKARFVDFSGPLPNAGPILSEYVFVGATIIRNIGDGSESYDFRGTKPVARKHGQSPPATNLTKQLASCWKYNAKKGVVVGESYDQVLGILTVTGNEDEIAFFPPGEFSDKPSLRFLATDSAGNVFRVEADPEDLARQLSISIDSPAKMWKMRLRGQPVAANGQLSVFLQRGDKFFGRDGALAEAAAAQGPRIKVNAKDQTKSALNLSDLHNDQTPQPAIQIGDKYVYRLESRVDNEGKVRWTAYVRADQEVDNSTGKPLPPTINCVVKTGKSGKSFNDGAWVRCLAMADGQRKASPEAQKLLLVD